MTSPRPGGIEMLSEALKACIQLGITFGTGFTMTPAVGAGLMSASTLIVAINAQLLRFYRKKG